MTNPLDTLGYFDLEPAHRRSVDALLSLALRRLSAGPFGDDQCSPNEADLGIDTGAREPDPAGIASLRETLKDRWESHALLVLLSQSYSGDGRFERKFETIHTKTVQLALGLAEMGEEYRPDIYTACRRVWLLQKDDEVALLEAICPFDQSFEDIHRSLSRLLISTDASIKPFQPRIEDWASVILRFTQGRQKQTRNVPGKAVTVPARVVALTDVSDGDAVLDVAVARSESVYPASDREVQGDQSPEGRFARMQDATTANDRSDGMVHFRGREILNGLHMRFAAPPCSYSRLTPYEISTAFERCYRRASTSPAHLVLLLSMIYGRDSERLCSLSWTSRKPKSGVAEAWVRGRQDVALYYRPELPLHADVELKRDDGDNGFGLPLPPAIGKPLEVLFRRDSKALCKIKVDTALRDLRENVSDRITTVRLHQSLAQSLTSNGIDEALVALIGGRSAEHCAALYYTSVSKGTVVEAFYAHLRTLLPAAAAASWKTPSTPPGIVGSRLRIEPETVSMLFSEQAKRIRQARKGAVIDLLDYHNELVAYTFQLLALTTATRAVTEPIGTNMDMNRASATLRLADKNNRMDGSSRLIALGDLALRQVHEYDKHLAYLATEFAVSDPRLLEQIQASRNGAWSWLFFLERYQAKTLTPNQIQKVLWERWRVPINWPRHFLRSWLIDQAFDRGTVRAFMGHADTGAPPQSRFDGASVYELHQLAFAVDEFLHSLQIPVVPAWNTPT